MAPDTYKVPNFAVFKEAKDVITKLVSVMDEQEQGLKNNRHLRFTEIDIEAERKAGRLAPDELYIPQHIIDTNIRREQATYIAYLTQSNRSVVLTNLSNPAMGSELVEKDFTNRSRYDGWQFPLFRAVDGMQQNGYGVVELVFDETKPGHCALQDVAYGDFGYSLDSKNLQSCEMVCRRYHLTKTQLLAMTKAEDKGGFGFTEEEIKKVVTVKDSEAADYKQQSLYRIEKVMFRKDGVVQVAWSCQERCDDWIRKPRPLSIGRKSGTDDVFETQYPYFLLPYTITENTIIQQHKGRCYLDQDYQEGVSSLMSSFVTAHRRSSYLMFSKESESDPNADAVTQSNVICASGKVINSKVKQFQLSAPDSTMLSAIQALASANMQENSQVNYAAQNREDSRKTATEIQAATQSQQQLSTVQLALFSTSLKAVYSTFFEITRSRILAGIITVADPRISQMYANEFLVKPAGDTDVVERLQKIQAMQTAWPVIQATPAAPLFLQKLLTLLFPDDAPQYIGAIQQGDAKTAAIATTLQVLTALVQDPNALTPEAKQQNEPQLLQLIQQLTQLLNPQPQTNQQPPTQNAQS